MISYALYLSNGRSLARVPGLEARKFMNEETAGMAEEHSFCNVCFPERQNEPFGDIRTSVGDSLLREIASATSELVSNELDVRCIFARKTLQRRLIYIETIRGTLRPFNRALRKIFPALNHSFAHAKIRSLITRVFYL